MGFGKIVPPPCISKEQTADEDKHFGGGVVTEIELKENRLSENGCHLIACQMEIHYL